MRKRNPLFILFVSLSLAFILIIGVYLGISYRNDKKEQNNLKDLQQNVVETVVKPKTDRHGNTVDPQLLRKIDFDKLSAINSDVATWIYIPGVGIDSYVMQEPKLGKYQYSMNNIYKKYNGYGSFLIPAEPDALFPDARLLIMGHHIIGSDKMFAKLITHYGDEASARKYRYIYLYYPDHAERWSVWAGCDVLRTDMAYNAPYEYGSDKYEVLLSHISKDAARYELLQKPDSDTRTLMLSTCNRAYHGTQGRFLVFAVQDEKYEYGKDLLTRYSTEDEAYAEWESSHVMYERNMRLRVMEKKTA